MKLKGLTKLVLAGTALAATAATLTTATYAWYVTNTTVTATGVQGSVSGNQIDGSLFIANHKSVAESGTQGEEGYVAAYEGPDKYLTDIALTAGTDFTETALNPQSKAIAVSDYYYFKTKDTEKADGKEYFTKLANGSYSEATGTESVKELFERVAVSSGQVWLGADYKKIESPSLLTFKFWLKSSAAGTASVKFMVDNTTTTAVNQVALTSGAGILPTGVQQGGSFVADAVNALRMEVVQQNGLNAAPSASKVYAVSEIAKNAAGTGNYTTAGSTAASRQASPITFATGGDANKYYYNILEEAPYNTGASGASTDSNTRTDAAWTSIELTADTDTLLTFNIWLEGSDADCWDSCRGQSFTFNFEFGFTATNNSNNG